MSTISELDTFYIKSINALHSKDHLLGGKPALQTLLEDAIKAKTGQERNLTSMVQILMKQSGVEISKMVIDDNKAGNSSDNELELDLLLKEDLACVVCQGMDVGARNRLLECSECHSLYHQECHQPAVSQQDADNTWVCGGCKEAKKLKSPSHSSSSSSSSSKPKSTSNSPRHSTERSSSSSSNIYKSSSSSSSKSKSSSSSSSNKSSSSKISSSSSSKHTPVTTSSTIISADKRIQNMKKKAAKLHEKKKLPR